MGGKFDMALYQAYTKTISPTLFDVLTADSSGYDFEKEVLPILELAMNRPEKLAQINDAFERVVKVNLAKVKDIIGEEIPVKVILYLGLCNGAGWAMTLDDEPTILLGVEKMIELDWCDDHGVGGLVYHELGHIWHAAVGTMKQSTNTVQEKYISQLYQEGIAMHFERLCVGDVITLQGSSGDWWSWCNANKQALNEEYLHRLRADESCQDFFGDWCEYLGKSNLGYFLGYEFINHLAKRYNLLELANFDIKTVYDEFVNYIE